MHILPQFKNWGEKDISSLLIRNFRASCLLFFRWGCWISERLNDFFKVLKPDEGMQNQKWRQGSAYKLALLLCGKWVCPLVFVSACAWVCPEVLCALVPGHLSTPLDSIQKSPAAPQTHSGISHLQPPVPEVTSITCAQKTFLPYSTRETLAQSSKARSSPFLCEALASVPSPWNRAVSFFCLHWALDLLL